MSSCKGHAGSCNPLRTIEHLDATVRFIRNVKSFTAGGRASGRLLQDAERNRAER
jgi:hypothetical protein